MCLVGIERERLELTICMLTWIHNRETYKIMSTLLYDEDSVSDVSQVSISTEDEVKFVS